MPQKDKGFTESFKETVTTLKKKAQAEGLMERKTDIAALILLLVGIIVSFFNVQWGAVFVGVVVGLTFADDIIDFFKGIKSFVKRGGAQRDPHHWRYPTIPHHRPTRRSRRRPHHPPHSRSHSRKQHH